jgi:hypothetical protein
MVESVRAIFGVTRPAWRSQPFPCRTALPKGEHFLIHIAKPRFTESSPHDRLLADLHLRPLHFHLPFDADPPEG